MNISLVMVHCACHRVCSEGANSSAVVRRSNDGLLTMDLPSVLPSEGSVTHFGYIHQVQRAHFCLGCGVEGGGGVLENEIFSEDETFVRF